MEFHKNRTIEKGLMVDVYRNLHHGGYSIRNSKTHLVLAHADSVLLGGGIEFKVNEKARLKTIAEKRKRVHAFVRGYFVSADEEKSEDMSEILIYDPYKTPLFTDVARGQSIHHLEGEVCFEGTVMYTRKSSIMPSQGSLFEL